jgi:hypothetical protein
MNRLRDFNFWQRWLVVVCVITAGFGVFIALFNGTGLFQTLFNDQIDPVFWDDNGPDARTQDFQQWAYGVLGAATAGWGGCLAFIAYYPFKRRERWARNAILAGIGVWFVLDSYVSLAAENYFNEFAVNAPLVVLVLLPMWFTRQAFD